MGLFRNKSGHLFTDDFYSVTELYKQNYCDICLDVGFIAPEYSLESRICGNCAGKIKYEEPVYFKKYLGLLTTELIVVGYKKGLK